MAKKEREKERRSLALWRPFFEEREMERMFDDFFERRLSPFRGGALVAYEKYWLFRSSGGSL